MNVFDKFERYGQKTYNGQDILKNHILTQYPKVFTKDVTDYEQVKQYAGKTDYVWLVEEGLETLRSFPWWFKPNFNEPAALHQFPYVFKASKRIKSYNKVQLVPTKSFETVVQQKHICGIYDVYCGKDRFDIFFIGDVDTGTYDNLIERFRNVKVATDYKEAQSCSVTDMFWVVPDDVEVSNIFKFNFVPDDWSQNFTHVFGNGNSDTRDGIALFPKHYTPTDNELKYRYYANKKELTILASRPRQYPVVEIKNYKDYQNAIDTVASDLFWYIPDDVEIVDEEIFDLYFSHQEQFERTINHVFLNNETYDGIVLFSKHSVVTEKEFTHRFYTNKKEHKVVASRPKKYDQFVVNNYADYELAKQRSNTEMFWGIPNDVHVNYNFDLYFSHHNQYDRNITHVFKNNSTYDGVVLFSKNTTLSEKEINHRFYARKKEWDIVASNPKSFDIFEIDSYNEYLDALENSSTDMFWMSSRNLSIIDYDQLENFYISHHNIVDRNQNHSFVHYVNSEKFRNGIFLLSKHKKLTKQEIEFRFLAEHKEWDIVLSTSVEYNCFNVETYQDYLYAMENSKTELFWATSYNIDWTLPKIYFTHDNEYDRKQNHAFEHCVDGNKMFNGLFLLSKHNPVTQKEIEYRHIVNCKEWNVLGSRNTKYDVFRVDTYEQYLEALKKSNTEMFWGTSNNIDCDQFDFNLYFTHDNEYDRKSNHNFIHRVNDTDYRNGLFLFSKHAPVTQKEIEHRFLVNAKEWNIVASGPKKYEQFTVETYSDYLNALKYTETEMFWVDSINIKSTIPDIYFTHDNEYDRKQNHAFIHRVDGNDYYNGLFLCSVHKPITKNEFNHRFIVDAKQWNLVGSTSARYDVYTIESYSDYQDAMENFGTEMFWGITPNISVREDIFDEIYFTHDNEYDRKINHSFAHKVGNEIYHNGLFLFSKNAPLSQKEIEYRHLINSKQWNVIGSTSVKYDVFEIDSYDEYLDALESSSTEMFWMSSRNITATIPDIYFTHDNEFDRKSNHNFLHCSDKRNGVFLCSKHNILTSKEVENRFIVNAKEWNIEASSRVEYDIFEIDSYDEYLDALENSYTEMFWMSSRNITATIPDIYFTHDNEYDRKQNHAFLHCGKYNGLFLCSKYQPLTSKEVEYRHVVNAKEWDIVGSNKKPYNIFVIDSYNDYLEALENSSTEMFWGTSANIDATIPDLYFTHDNDYDRKSNHNFIHKVNGKEYRNGLFLFSKHAVVTQKEIDHRFLINAKEWNIVGSGPKQYEKFTINNYNDYVVALENSTTEMFYGIPSDVYDNFEFDLYFTHDNEYDRKTNHVFLNGEHRDGIVLFSKHAVVTQKEIENRFYVNKKDWNIVASTPKPYDIFFVETYNDYLDAIENSTTEMFWATTHNIQINKDFDSSLYFSHHEAYDRRINHTFIHRANGEDLHNGLFLLTKHALLTQKEIEHRLIAKRKEHNIVASGPVSYDQFVINTYDDYEFALRTSKTEMFWMIPPEVNVDPNFKFDLYFTHNQWFERETNHVFMNGTAWDGIALISKKSLITEREIKMRFLANKKQYDIVASTPTPYDIVFISKDEEQADKNYATLIERFPRAMRVHGVKGIHAAHIEAAKICETDMIWIVDADAEIIEKFTFDYYVPAYDPDSRKTVHVWKSQNPINSLIYGYGAVKLLPRELTLTMDTNKPDMTTSISPLFKSINRISNITRFNTDEFSTWRSAFRECVKLSARAIDGQLDEETEFRLNVWCTRGKDKLFGEYCIAGANAGKLYGEANRSDLDSLRKINDFEWLRNQFDNLKHSL